MARRQPSDADLQEDSHHVLYEMEQLAGAVNRLAGIAAAGQKPPDIDANALLENVALHARALIEFAYGDPKKARSDDVIAADFLPEWPDIRPEMTDFLEEVKWRVGKEMMHITRARSIAEEVRRWKYGRIYNELSNILTGFIVQVPPEKVQPNFPVRAMNAFPAARQQNRLKENESLLGSAHSPTITGATQAAPGIDLQDE